MHSFDWQKIPQLSVVQLILATAAPSAVAFLGFHFLSPRLVESGIPSVYVWFIVAAPLLFLFSLAGLLLLAKEAKQLHMPLSQRLCLRPLSLKGLLLTIAVLIGAFLLSLLAAQSIIPLMNFFKFNVPSYTPFFLNPRLNVATTPNDVLTPGVSLSGNYGFVFCLAGTLLLNIAAEEIYFRAWMLPKLSKSGLYAWVINGVVFACYHTFQIWLFPQLLVASLGMAFVFFRTKSIYSCLIGHLFGNFPIFVLGILTLVMR